MSDEQRGVELLRETVETVATGIESDPTPARRNPKGWPWLAVAAAVVVVAVGAALLQRTLAPADATAPEVEVVELKIRGEVVRAEVVEDSETRTIIVMPRTGDEPVAGLASMLWGELP